MTISLTRSEKYSFTSVSTGGYTSYLGSLFYNADYTFLTYVILWHRSSSTEPTLPSTFRYYKDGGTPEINLTLINTQTRNEAIADGGYLTVGTYVGKCPELLGGNTYIDITLGGPATIDNMLVTNTIYTGTPNDVMTFVGPTSENSGDSMTHDYGSVGVPFPNYMTHLFAVVWDTTTNIGSYSFDTPTGFVSLQNQAITNTAGEDYGLEYNTWEDGVFTSPSTVTPSPDDTSTKTIQYITELVVLYGDNSLPNEGGMGVFF